MLPRKRNSLFYIRSKLPSKEYENLFFTFYIESKDKIESTKIQASRSLSLRSIQTSQHSIFFSRAFFLKNLTVGKLFGAT